MKCSCPWLSRWFHRTPSAKKDTPPVLEQPSPTYTMPQIGTRRSVTVCALYDFEPTESTELRFHRDEILEVIDKHDEPWIMAFNTQTKEKGLIPHNYVTDDTKVSGALEAWYPVTRVQAEKLLLVPGRQLGAYLIRPSREGNMYALSVRAIASGQVRILHFKIYHSTEPLQFYLDKRHVFGKMNELIDFYKGSPLKDGCILTQPCQREKPSAPFRAAELPRESVRMIALIDRGNFGEVWLGQIQNVKVAIKKPLRTTDKEDFLREAKKMHTLWHPRLVQFMGVCIEPESEPILIITEYMEKGSLAKYLPSEKGLKLVSLDLLLVMDQVADGMCYLESIEFVHRDLRAANVFVGNDFQIKVGDFGQSKMMSLPSATPLDIMTPIRWSSPEALVDENKVTTKSDVWQFGILGYEVFTHGGRPYNKYQDQGDAAKAIKRGEVLERPQKCPEPFYQMMLTCWAARSSLRPSFKQLKAQLEELIESLDDRYVPEWANFTY